MSVSKSFLNETNETGLQRPKKIELFLLAPERAQKLDLLVHLVANLDKPLIVRGGQGIGKTTLLNEFINIKKADWNILQITANHELSFEKIQYQLIDVEKKDPFHDMNHADFSIISSSTENRKIVLVIDNAVELIEGLMDSLIQFISTKPNVSLIFSLSNVDFMLKSTTDTLIEQCHVLDIPPLTRFQSEGYIKSLAVLPHSTIKLKNVNEQLVDKIFKETQGIPGKIYSLLTQPSDLSKITSGSLKWLIFPVAGAILLVGLGYLWIQSFQQTPENKSSNRSPQISSTPNASVVSKAYPNHPLPNQERKVNDSKTTIEEKTLDALTHQSMNGVSSQTINQVVLKSDVRKNDVDKPTKPSHVEVGFGSGLENLTSLAGVPRVQSEVNKTPGKTLQQHLSAETKNAVQQNNRHQNTEQTSRVVQQTISAKKNSKQQENPPLNKQRQSGEARDWLLKQSGRYYTIQLMTLSTQESAQRFVQQKTNLREPYRYVKQKNKFVILYGSYKSQSIAAQKMSQLPVKYQKSWIRRISHLQNNIK